MSDLVRDGFDSSSPWFFGLIAELDGAVVGHAFCNRAYSSWTCRAYYLEDLYVRPRARRHRVGQHLMRELCRVQSSTGGGHAWPVLFCLMCNRVPDGRARQSDPHRLARAGGQCAGARVLREVGREGLTRERGPHRNASRRALHQRTRCRAENDCDLKINVGRVVLVYSNCSITTLRSLRRTLSCVAHSSAAIAKTLRVAINGS